MIPYPNSSDHVSCEEELPGTNPATPDVTTALALTDEPVTLGAEPEPYNVPDSATIERLFDDQTTTLINEIEPGLNTIDRGQKVDRVLAWLAGYNGLSPSALDDYLEALNSRLKTCQYPTRTLTAYRKILQAHRKPTQSGARSGSPMPRYSTLSRSSDQTAQSGACGIWDSHLQSAVTNFEVEIRSEYLGVDQYASERMIHAALVTARGATEFRMSASDYANDKLLASTLTNVGGTSLRIDCRWPAFRNAIAESNPNSPVRQFTRDFGWVGTGSTEFLTPSVRIDAHGFHPYQDNDCRPDLSDCPWARSLDLPAPEPGELKKLKHHVAGFFLGCHDPGVTYPLLGTVVAALLVNFAPGFRRYGLWLTGLTGSGKSFVAGLCQHFFGDFGGLAASDASGRIQSWSSTANHVQLAGYSARNAIYLVDDFKPNTLGDAERRGVLKLLQNYTDEAARGRLRSDSNFQEVRPIRGFLVSTGEDLPEHSASTLARLIPVRVDQAGQNSERGKVCLRHCRRYGAFTAGLVQWLISQKIPEKFQESCEAWRDRFLDGKENTPNAPRVCSNLGLLAASLEVVAKFLSDVWHRAVQKIQAFLRRDLFALRDELLLDVRQEQESEIFLRTLVDLLEYGVVRILDLDLLPKADNVPAVGRVTSAAGTADKVIQLCLTQALGAVQTSLREQARPELRVTHQTLIGQLRQGGHLGSEGSKTTRLGAGNPVRCFDLSYSSLVSMLRHSAAGNSVATYTARFRPVDANASPTALATPA
jgi:hypothetical protein